MATAAARPALAIRASKAPAARKATGAGKVGPPPRGVADRCFALSLSLEYRGERVIYSRPLNVGAGAAVLEPAVPPAVVVPLPLLPRAMSPDAPAIRAFSPTTRMNRSSSV